MSLPAGEASGCETVLIFIYSCFNLTQIDNYIMEIDTSEDFILYKKRFFVVFLFAFSQLMISVLLNTLNPIAAFLCIIYHQDPVVVNLGGLLFALMHPIFTFPASYVIDTYGTRVGIALGCVLGMLGVSLRMLINHHFAWVIVGQVIAGIGRPFILNCQAKIAANWFSSSTRGGVTQLLTLVLNVSLIIGILIPGFVFKGYAPDESDPENLAEGRHTTFKLMMVETIMAAVCFLPNMLFQDSLPPTPPSESGLMPREPFKIAMPKMLKNTNYMLLLIAFGCYFGIFNAISIILSYLIEPFFSEESLPMAVAAVGGSPIISGILGVIILGPIQRKEGLFKKWIIICMCGTFINYCRLHDCGASLLPSAPHPQSLSRQLHLSL